MVKSLREGSRVFVTTRGYALDGIGGRGQAY